MAKRSNKSRVRQPSTSSGNTFFRRSYNAGPLRIIDLAVASAPGNAPLVVILHGRGVSSSTMLPVVHSLNIPGYRYILPDAPIELQLDEERRYSWWESDS